KMGLFGKNIIHGVKLILNIIKQANLPALLYYDDIFLYNSGSKYFIISISSSSEIIVVRPFSYSLSMLSFIFITSGSFLSMLTPFSFKLKYAFIQWAIPASPEC